MHGVKKYHLEGREIKDQPSVYVSCTTYPSIPLKERDLILSASVDAYIKKRMGLQNIEIGIQ